MTKSKKVSSHSQPGPTLFEALIQSATQQPEIPLTWGLDIKKQFKAALAEDLRHARDDHGREISRAIVAARMSDLLGEKITEKTIDNWTAPSHKHRMPADIMWAWIQATGSRTNAAELVCRCAGLFLLPGPEALEAEIQRLDDEEKRIRKEKRNRKFYLKQLKARRNGL